MAETCCEMTHSHLMKWQMAKLKMAIWAHLLLCNLKQIHIIRFTMHNTNCFVSTNYVKIYTQVQVQWLEIGWLKWVAPDNASTTSALSMTYSTPALLVRAGQGVFFVSFSFSFWVQLAQLKHPWTSLEPWLILQVQNQRPPTLFSGLKLCQLIFLTFELLLQALQTHLSQLTSGPAPACTSSPTPFQPYQPPVPGGPTDDKDLSCLPTSPLPVSWRQWQWQNRQDHPRPQGKGIGQALGRNWHKERISLKLCQKPLLPEAVPPPLTGTFVLVTPIELHGDLKHIITFYGGYGIGL